MEVQSRIGVSYHNYKMKIIIFRAARLRKHEAEAEAEVCYTYSNLIYGIPY